MSKRCARCSGSGELICENCGGHGFFREYSGDDADCRLCDGMGTIDCPTCSGIGESAFRLAENYSG